MSEEEEAVAKLATLIYDAARYAQDNGDGYPADFRRVRDEGNAALDVLRSRIRGCRDERDARIAELEWERDNLKAALQQWRGVSAFSPPSVDDQPTQETDPE